MSGGIAYVLDEDSDLYMRMNKELVSVSVVSEKADILELKNMIEEHVKATDSPKGKEILDNFDEYVSKFKKILPNDYAKMMQTMYAMEEKGMTPEQAKIEAFYINTRK
ncbi:glutamate synthase (Ferredoxin) [Eubacterium sp. CAG:581]|nr:glutamate synthase (Ferredoxin) [Eubacterium sp. CAG:581]